MGSFFGSMLDGFRSGRALGVSTACFDLAALLFLVSTVGYVIYLGWRRHPAWLVGYSTAVIGLGFQTVALVLRWVAGGWDHPPFTNLYESLVFFGWGIVLVYVIVEALYKVRIAGALIIPIAFLAMGIASLSPNKGIEPLMPALQDIWLHLHVFSASVGYAAFLIAFGFAVLYLVKDELPPEYFGITSSLFTLFAAVAVTKGAVFTAEFPMTKMAFHSGKWIPMAAPGTGEAARVAIPGAGALLLATCLVLATAAVLLGISLKTGGRTRRLGFSAFTVGLFLHTVFFVSVLAQVPRMANATLGGDAYSIAFVGLAWILAVIVRIFHLRLEAIRELLPGTRTLDQLGYRAVVVAFPIMTFVIVSGAVWANKAWGRYWGWDPKETASLVTWAIYLLYLHARFTAKWTGRRAAVISIVGFVSVVFTYLGVNLVLSGLHSYAAG